MFDATGSTGIPACMSRIAGVSASLPCLVDVGQVTNKKADLWQKIGFLRLSSGGRFAGADVPAREQPIVAAHLPQRTTICQGKTSRLREIVRFLDFLAQWKGIKWRGYLSGFLAFFAADLAE